MSMDSQLSIQNIGDCWEDEQMITTTDSQPTKESWEDEHDSKGKEIQPQPINCSTRAVVDVGKLKIDQSLFRPTKSSNKIVEVSDEVINEMSARTEAFLTISKKDNIAKILKFTKACNNVKKDEKGVFSKCSKLNCTFAHTTQEWKPAKCQFGAGCRFSRTSRCKFFHDNETLSEWQHRTNEIIPELPESTCTSTSNYNNDTSRKTNLKIIRVPTQELAQQALEYAFKNSMFNIQIEISN